MLKQIGCIFSVEILEDFEIKKHDKLREKHPSLEEIKKIKISEEYDGYYSAYYTKEEAITLFKEIINWIEENA